MAKTSGTTPASVTATAPCRVDLAGGTLDLWPLYLFHPGAVTVNFAVNILTRCSVQRRNDKQIVLRSLDTGRTDKFADFEQFFYAKKYEHAIAAYLVHFFAQKVGSPKSGFEIETHSESPAGAGISGSSALMIASTAALAKYTGVKLDREQIRVIAQNVEAQIIRVPTGCQDYYPALYGGVSAVNLDTDGIRREAIQVPPNEVEDRFVVIYTGAPRQSGINNWEVFKAHINGDKKVFRNFQQISDIACEMRAALGESDWKAVEKLLRAEWKLRKTNAPGITTKVIDAIVSEGLKNGGRAAKVCGAGGGGCLVMLIDPAARERISDIAKRHGGRALPFKVAREGVTVATGK